MKWTIDTYYVHTQYTLVDTLAHVSVSENLIDDRLLWELKEHLITSCTKALNLGSSAALAWVPRLLQLIELYPDIAPLLIEKVITSPPNLSTVRCLFVIGL